MNTENIKRPQTNNDEIDLITLFQPIWLERKKIIKWIVIGGVIGLMVAILTPNQYVATSILAPSGTDNSSKLGGMSGLGGLAAMAGISMNTSSGTELSPIIYPKIVSSLPFMLELMNTPLNFRELNKPVTLFEYYSELQKPNLLFKYTLGLPAVIINAIKGEEPNINTAITINEPLELTLKQRSVFLTLKKLVSLEADPKEGILTLTTTMPEAKAAAQLGQRAQLLLQKYITEFKIRKAKANLEFIQQRVDETNLKFEAAQLRLALFRDRNKNVSLATAKAEEERLTSQYNLIFGVYSELSKQLEQSKIQVKQDTPVFTIIEPVSVPSKKSYPNRPLILILGLFTGAIFGVIVVISKRFAASLK
ncbi:MAG: GNVR domain-containing protein [Mariniphaga sp.]